MNKKLILLIPLMILLASSIQAVDSNFSDYVRTNNTIYLGEYGGNTSQSNDTALLVGAETAGFDGSIDFVNYITGEESINFATAGGISFTDARLNQMPNYTYSFWAKCDMGSTGGLIWRGTDSINWGSDNSIDWWVGGDPLNIPGTSLNTNTWIQYFLVHNLTQAGEEYLTIYENTTKIGQIDTGDALIVANRAANDLPLKNCKVDSLMVTNFSMPDDTIILVHEYTKDGGRFFEVEALPPDTTLSFDVTAVDAYNSSIPLTNITLSVFNSSDSFNFSTVNGTIIITNQTIQSFDNFYSMTFGSNDTGGYFNSTFTGINITDGESFTGNVTQSFIKVVAVDTLNNNQTINSFSVVLGLKSDSTTNGELLLSIKEGKFNINVTAAGFEKFEGNFSILALQNNTFNASMGSRFTFNLIREETNTPFIVNLTNSTELNIFCPNETIQILFSETNQSNITQIINCQFTLMQIVVDYGVLGSYSRTLIPGFGTKTITWYLIDLISGDTAIQRIITLLDLTGEFQNSIMIVKRAITGESVLKTIIEQHFDISDQVNLFLVKNGLYTLSIDNGVEEMVLGNLIPTEAGTQTITLPKLDFVPKEIRLGNNITWAYTFNISQNILRVQYRDETNLTTLVRFTIFNGSNNQVFLGESNQNSSVTITFNQAFANQTYSSTLFVMQQSIGNFTDKKIWYEFGGTSSEPLSLPGWNLTDQSNIKHWFVWIFLAFWGLLFSRRYIGIGMTTLVMWMFIFQTIKWITVPAIIYGFVILIAVVGWIAEAIKKE